MKKTTHGRSEGSSFRSHSSEAGAKTATLDPKVSSKMAADSKGAASPNLVRITASDHRVPVSIDLLSAGTNGQSRIPALTLQKLRIAAQSNIYLGLQDAVERLKLVQEVVSTGILPPLLIGTIHQPDGTAAPSVQVEFDPNSVGAKGPIATALTGGSGEFQLSLLTRVTIPRGGISLLVRGAAKATAVPIPARQIASNGVVGVIQLTDQLDPLPVSIVAALQALVPDTPSTQQQLPSTKTHLPSVKLGEPSSKGAGGEDLGAQTFSASQTVDRFPYAVFFRLVEPQMSNAFQVEQVQAGGKNYFPMPNYEYAASAYSENAPRLAGGTEPNATSYIDRVPVEQPLSVDGFHDEIAGLDQGGDLFTAGQRIPVAGTLGLGYLLWLSQEWTFKGLGLGDLVYSLPLAPGEQQQVAVFERTDTSAVYESESFSEAETLRQQALSDTSTSAVFNSAFYEKTTGSSNFNASSSSSSWAAGGGLGLAIGPVVFGGGGGYSHGSSDSSGHSDTTLEGNRTYTQTAAQDMHSAAESQAVARRTANRTGMRLASTSESEEVITKTITNHNHTRALTMQYWEVLRMYDVATTINGLDLACLVPLEPVRFMPPGQPLTLLDTSILRTRGEVLARYQNIIKHLDVLQRAVPRSFQYGLTLLAQFASDPTAEVEPFGGTAEDVIQIQFSGSFLCCESVYVTAVTRRNTRVGPVQLTHPEPTSPPLPPDTFSTKEEILANLLASRQNLDKPMHLMGALALPPSMNRSDIIGFEILRSFQPLSYTLISPARAALNELQSSASANGFLAAAAQTMEAVMGANAAAAARTTITIMPYELENALGGPQVLFFRAFVTELNGTPNPPPQSETYANDNLGGTVLPARPYPIPALQVAPVLRFQEILEIEKTAQHIVRNTIFYSKVVWVSLSAEERAILLDGYTIGVPSTGISDASQMVPLLNCVQNKVLGFFGNSMILPFQIPESLALRMKIQPEQLISALLTYQQRGFAPPHSTVALPTRGVLGEAVLGHYPSAEMIDLSRFWNWQDSPSDAAPTISPVTLPTPGASIAAGLTAPNSLANLQPLINNVLQAPSPNTSLLQSMGQAAAGQQDFSSTLTGAAQLAGLVQNAQNTANAARADALKSSTNLAAQAMATIGNLAGSGQLSSPTTPPSPGTDGAATASNGQSPASTGAGQTGGKQQSPSAGSSPNPNAGSSAAAAVYGTAAPGQGQTQRGGGSGGSSSSGSAPGGGSTTITITIPASGAGGAPQVSMQVPGQQQNPSTGGKT